MSPRSSLLLAFVLACVAATGCAQANGEVCQLDSDCESGMICCKATAAEMTNPSARGICRADEAACTASRVMDSGQPDAQVDSGSDAGSDAGFSEPGERCFVPDEDGGVPTCFAGLVCFRGICLEPDPDRDGGPDPVDSGTDAGGIDGGLDAGSPPDAGSDAGLDGGP